MAIEVIGRGKKITARLITLERGSPRKPWLLIRDCDVGPLPIGAYRLKREAAAAASLLTAEEDDRYKRYCRTRGKKAKVARGVFDIFHVVRYDR